ncbi:glycosyltransferase family 2 protein [Vibrio cionasavignyae]|uniref:glycosyltransferase family 2 protein n=1 Tax=Vibrio cionasavignyae TaxID=2910252 RepID=UPI003D0A26E8
MKPISIVIITLNEEKRIAKLLGDLSKQTYQQFEVILVDSNSDDHTTQVAEKFRPALPSLTVHTMTERGVSRGRNTGARLANYERLLFLDADVRLDKQFLDKAITKLHSERLEVAGVYMGAQQLSWGYKSGYALFNAGLFATQYFFPTAVGACIFSTQRAHKENGGFDEAIILCEDCHYVKKAAKTWRFRFLPLTFQFDPRRLEQDGLFTMGLTYLKANVRRFLFGEMRNNEMKYQFGHYQ